MFPKNYAFMPPLNPHWYRMYLFPNQDQTETDKILLETLCECLRLGWGKKHRMVNFSL